MKRTYLKGGSLSATYLCNPENAAPFVRKEVSLKANREYGFQRWYSQLKRIQRYQHLFPDLFPRLFSYGMQDELAYFDIEYIPNAVTALEFVTTVGDVAKIEQFLDAFITAMERMHHITLPSFTGAIDLYIHEEIEQRLAACAQNDQFRRFTATGFVYLNGQRVPGLLSALDEYKECAASCYRATSETFTHGNLTLENVLYDPSTDRVVFIDPYEENIIDSALAEYSQICQSSNSHYELYNDSAPRLDGNRVDVQISIPEGLRSFNELFARFLRSRCSELDIAMIRLFEVSQYARMLPFKMEIDQDKMLLFYSVGSYLFYQLREEGAFS